MTLDPARQLGHYRHGQYRERLPGLLENVAVRQIDIRLDYRNGPKGNDSLVEDRERKD